VDRRLVGVVGVGAGFEVDPEGSVVGVDPGSWRKGEGTASGVREDPVPFALMLVVGVAVTCSRLTSV
jgi:hypothetical protein